MKTHKYLFKCYINAICNRDSVAVQGAYKRCLLGENPNYKEEFGNALYSHGTLMEY